MRALMHMTTEAILIMSSTKRVKKHRAKKKHDQGAAARMAELRKRRKQQDKEDKEEDEEFRRWDVNWRVKMCRRWHNCDDWEHSDRTLCNNPCVCKNGGCMHCRRCDKRLDKELCQGPEWNEMCSRCKNHRLCTEVTERGKETSCVVPKNCKLGKWCVRQ